MFYGENIFMQFNTNFSDDDHTNSHAIGQGKLLKSSVPYFSLRAGAILYPRSPVQTDRCPLCSQSELASKA